MRKQAQLIQSFSPFITRLHGLANATQWEIARAKMVPSPPHNAPEEVWHLITLFTCVAMRTQLASTRKKTKPQFQYTVEVFD